MIFNNLTLDTWKRYMKYFKTRIQKTQLVMRPCIYLHQSWYWNDFIVYVFQLKIYIKQESSLILWVHSNGLLRSELPYSSNIAAMFPNTSFLATMDLTVSKSVEYDGKECNADSDYNQDDCRFEYIHKVSFSSTNMQITQIENIFFSFRKWLEDLVVPSRFINQNWMIISTSALIPKLEKRHLHCSRFTLQRWATLLNVHTLAPTWRPRWWTLRQFLEMDSQAYLILPSTYSQRKLQLITHTLS